MPDLSVLLTLFQLILKDRTQLALENLALRQQLAVYKRTVTRPKIEDRDRIFWLSVMRMLKEWKEALVFVQPATVIRWQSRASATTGGGSRGSSLVARRSAWRSSS